LSILIYVEIGATRAKHVKATLLKNLLDQSVAAICWMFIGWGIFKEAKPTFFQHPESEYAVQMQQFRFAATSITIVSGAVLTRCKLEVYVLFAAITSALTYPYLAHLVWHGELHDMGVEDTAGGLAVHVFGGTCALVGAALCGPRAGRKREGPALKTSNSKNNKSLQSFHMAEDEPLHKSFMAKIFYGTKRTMRGFCLRCTLQTKVSFKEQPGHSSSFAVTGVLLLYVSWFAFNAGSSGGMTTQEQITAASRAAINTSLGSGASATVGFLYSKFLLGKHDIDFTSNCVLAGLVAVTAGCGYMSPYLGCAAGVLAVPVYHFCSWFVSDVLLIDDPLDAAAVHLGCGAFGSIWVGFSDLRKGAFLGYGPAQLRLQIIAVSVAFLWGLVTSLVIFGTFKITGLLCYTDDEQTAGLDYIFYGGYAFPDYDGSIAGEKLDDEAVRQYHVTKRMEDQRKAELEKRKSVNHSLMSRIPSFRNAPSPSSHSRRSSRRESKDSSKHGGSEYKDSSKHGGSEFRGGSEDYGTTNGRGGGSEEHRRGSEDMSVTYGIGDLESGTVTPTGNTPKAAATITTTQQ
jgi:Amt family ammonium transporter